MAVLIYVGEASHEFDPGLTSGAHLHELTGCHLRLWKGDVSIPILPEDHLLIRGGEKFAPSEKENKENTGLQEELKPEFNGTREVTLAHSKITAQDLKKHDKQFPDGRLFAETPNGIDVEISDEVRLVVQNEDSYFVIPPGDFGGVIDLEKCGKSNRRVPKGCTYRYRLDHEMYVSETEKISGVQILAQADKILDEWSLNQKLHGGKRIKIDGDWVDLTESGIERFESIRRHAQQGR